LNFIKDATLDAATEIEAITQFIIEQAAENVEFPNSAVITYMQWVYSASLYVCKNCCC
jgi:hypothetical protein